MSCLLVVVDFNIESENNGPIASLNPKQRRDLWHTDKPRVLYYDTPANRINLDGDALLVRSDDANDVRHETLSHRGPHQAIAVAHLVLRNLVDKDVEGLPSCRSVQLDDVADPHIVQKHVRHFKPVILTVIFCRYFIPHGS